MDVRREAGKVTSFKHLAAIHFKDVASTAEFRIIIAIAAAAITRLSRYWTSCSISFLTKKRLYKSHVVSILRLRDLDNSCRHRTHDTDLPLNTRISEDCFATLTRSTRPARRSGTRQPTKVPPGDCQT
ncbi:hypothetical protein DPMN_136314 [Dreissena polymorpha]|uniref:Uncharacterized protein n=1 Tax=Dreissena polymorpha TaxID=45954 RepID=A0A9D4JCJ3_DREPO|nr:hypothetical protein DPMN_136314 [Dreissena polymorpha]